jgi:transposase
MTVTIVDVARPVMGSGDVHPDLRAAPCPVTGGVDTHLDLNVAAALDGIGGLLGVAEFPATLEGHRQMPGWLSGFGPVARVGVEGTGSYGAGLARFLRRAGVVIVEVDRPGRQARRRAGKSGPLDAIEAARAALSGRACGVAKSRDGNVEAIRALVVARRSARSAKIQALNQIRHLGFTAPDELRQRLAGVSRQQLAAKAAALRPGSMREGADPVMPATKTALQILGRRVLALDAGKARIDALLPGLVTQTAPAAAGPAWRGHRHRGGAAGHRGGQPGAAAVRGGLGAPVRHRPHPGLLGQGDPLAAQPGRGPASQPGPAGHRDHPAAQRPRTQAYMDRRLAEGRSKPEVIRILKRYVAREVCRHLPRP